jgi:hypothetical protein
VPSFQGSILPDQATRGTEPIRIAVQMRSGGAYAHSAIALDSTSDVKTTHGTWQ